MINVKFKFQDELIAKKDSVTDNPAEEHNPESVQQEPEHREQSLEY